MTQSISATYKHELVITQTNVSDANLQSASDSIRQSTSLSFTSGTGANQADRAYTNEFTLASGSTTVLDLTSTSVFTDNFNSSAVMARVKEITITNPTATYGSNTGTLEVGSGATNPWLGFLKDGTDKVTVRPGGQISFHAPDATAMAVSTASCNLQFEASGGNVSPQVVILGASA
ncbi:MAG: hypothetical protein HZA50_11615 [Planctomycetes bacterium]|nr:hypothetical protein [Planctomycetota bacterium]